VVQERGSDRDSGELGRIVKLSKYFADIDQADTADSLNYKARISRLPALSIAFTSLAAGRRVRRISVGGLP
jgi:hypothetical protein